MSQKIVIKTQMKEPTPTPRSVEYQWHWRRVVVALGLFSNVIGSRCLWYF